MHRKLLPFYNDRKCKIDMIVIHCTAHTPKEAILAFTTQRLSSHYIIGEDGEVWQTVGEKHRAWHAGVSSWQGQTDINSRSIGIELSSPTLGQKPFSQMQKNALVSLLKRLIKKYKILPQNIVGHSDVAPTRKADPNRAFFWDYLYQQGLGIYYNPNLKNTCQCTDIAQLLHSIGYDTTDLNAAKLAFCRRFIPQSLSGEENPWEIEKNLKSAINNFQTPPDFLKVLNNIAQQYESASKTPCKM